MDIFIKIYIVIFIGLNSLMLYYDGKKIYKSHKEKKERLKNSMENIEKQKQSLIKSFSRGIIKPSKKIVAHFSKEENEKFENILEKLKTENNKIYIFIQSMINIMPKESLIKFMDKVEDISIEYHSFKEAENNRGVITTGTYIPMKNQIKIYSDKNEVLYHELLHVASSNNEYNMVGFSIVFKKAGLFCNGLNEGYTELLNQRLFQSKTEGYIYLTYLALELENFYENKEDMMKDYFNNDIFSLIDELKKSMTLEEAVSIISDMDLFLNQTDVSFLDFLKLRKKIISIYERRYIQNEKTFVKKIINRN